MIKQVYGKEALDSNAVFAVFERHRCVAQRRDRLKDDEHTCQPRTVRTEFSIQEDATLVHANCSQTVQQQQQGFEP
jgi:nucleoside diphosphate kinase